MKILSLFYTLIICLSFFALLTGKVTASGVKLIMDGNTYYLSSQEDTNNSDKTYRVVEASDSASISTRSGVLPGDIVAPMGYSQRIGDLITFLLKVVMIIALLLVLLNLITAGFEWITSGGDKGKTEGARNRIIAVFVGILILASSYAVTRLVAYILGFDSFEAVFNSIRRINTP